MEELILILIKYNKKVTIITVNITITVIIANKHRKIIIHNITKLMTLLISLITIMTISPISSYKEIIMRYKENVNIKKVYLRINKLHIFQQNQIKITNLLKIH
jgi:hypothetical protein